MNMEKSVHEKTTSILLNHLERLTEIDVEKLSDNPALLLAVTNDIKQSIGLLLILNVFPRGEVKS